ncbi:transcriptional adapter ADA2b-like isoform X2 [Andrographis paniculata]|uniref:transcriptional adapter ADA2b-like isoform X2 n=1 Tax=Andrographis paniculata TaxID=175694 RepID=UPI0021E75134|nr:transcriptional adapter ADA2b-like isoform X2 [Andrographis paniculata]
MGRRSRGNFHAKHDPKQRSRRKKRGSDGEHVEPILGVLGDSDEQRVLHHCNYCNKDLTGIIHIKCALCFDFDLCVECFSVGAEIHPHKSGHPYRVMDVPSFPLTCPEWSAYEEKLMLEGLDMYGAGDWAKIADHVGTKTKEVCIEHYRNAYLNSPYFPLPDMTNFAGKSREELLAMAKEHCDNKKGEHQLQEESPCPPSRIKVEDSYRDGAPGRSPSNPVVGSKVNKKVSNNTVTDHGDVQNMDEHISGRSFGGNKHESADAEAPSLMDAVGYNPKRHQFVVEYDNDAEQLLYDLEFKDADTEDEHALKLKVVCIYTKRCSERERRKDFIRERNLLHPSPFEKSLSQEEKNICRQYDRFMRFNSKEEHEKLLESVISEHRLLKRIHGLKEAKAAGCRTSSEADRYLELKRQEAEDATGRKESSQAGPSSQESIPISSDSFGTNSTTTSTGQAHSSTDLDFASILGASLLSEDERQLCREIGLAPQRFLKIQGDMTMHVLSGSISKKTDAHSFFQIEPEIVDKVYDVLLKKGLVQS